MGRAGLRRGLRLAGLSGLATASLETSIPTISLAWPRADIVAAITENGSAGGPGFFYLADHGVPQSVFDDAVHASHVFHALPDAVKEAVSSANYGGSVVASGWSRPGTQGGYTKDAASDARDAAHPESLAANTRGSFVLRLLPASLFFPFPKRETRTTPSIPNSYPCLTRATRPKTGRAPCCDSPLRRVSPNFRRKNN